MSRFSAQPGGIRRQSCYVHLSVAPLESGRISELANYCHKETGAKVYEPDPMIGCSNADSKSVDRVGLVGVYLRSRGRANQL